MRRASKADICVPPTNCVYLGRIEQLMSGALARSLGWRHPKLGMQRKAVQSTYANSRDACFSGSWQENTEIYLKRKKRLPAVTLCVCCVYSAVRLGLSELCRYLFKAQSTLLCIGNGMASVVLHGCAYERELRSENRWKSL